MKKLFSLVLIGLFVLALLPQMAQAQFGKNLVVYEKINWKIYESPHFEIYYYFPNKDDWAREKEYIADMVRWTEAAFEKIKEEINYDQLIYDSKGKKAKPSKLKPFYDTKKKKHYKPPIFIFWSRFHADHHPLFGPMGAIAYAENQRMKLVYVSKEFPESLNQRIVIHEVCHLFQFDLWKLAKARPSHVPQFLQKKLLTFLFEGWSQHISGLHRIMPNTQLIIKYFVLDKIVRYVNIKDWIKYDGAPEISYVLAGYLYDYIKETYGPDTFSIFVKEFRNAKPTDEGFEKTVNRVLKTDLAELDRGYRKYLEDQYKHFPIEKKEAFEYGRDILLQRTFFQKGFFKPVPKPEEQEKKKVDAVYEPVVSPSGNLVAGFIVDGDSIAVALMDRYYGTLVKKLTGGYSLYKYGLYPIVDLDGAGRTLSFSPNGDYVLYFAQTAGRNPILNLINVITETKKVKFRGKEIEQTKIKSKVKKVEIEFNDPESPEMSRDGKTVVFSAIRNGQRDIFSLNLETKEVQNLTSDESWNYGPSFSPDEKTIVYVADVGGYKKLFSLNPETQEKKQITFGLSNETRPVYSQDGKTIWFISDADKDKTRNIYSLSVENNKVSQWTDVINGVRIVTPLTAKNLLRFNLGITQIFVPVIENKLLFGAIGYRDSEHYFTDNLYEMDLNQSQAVANADNLLQEIKQPEPEQIEISEIDPKNIKKYSTKFHLVDAMFYGGSSNFYGWYGLGYAYLNDLTNTKHIQASVMTFGERYKYNTISYFDISKRLGWGAAAGFEDHYFYPWFVSWGYNPYGQPAIDPVLYNLRFKRTKFDVIAQYPLDLCHRLEFTLSGTNIKYTSINWQAWADYYRDYPEYADWYQLRADFLKKYINDGKFVTFNLGFVRDTALFKQFGPFINDMYRFDLSWSTGGHNITTSGEARKYLRLGSEWSFAVRGYAGAQFVGKKGTITPWIIGDLGELRGYEWMQFMGNRIWLANFELRFPLIKNLNLFGLSKDDRPINFGDIRVALFCDLAKIWFDDKRFNVLNYDDINSGLIKGSAGIDLSVPFTMWIFGSELHLAISKRMTEVKFLPKFEDKWQVKLYFGYSF